MKTNKYIMVGAMAAFLLGSIGSVHAYDKFEAYRAVVESTKGIEPAQGSILQHVSKYDREQPVGTMLTSSPKEQAPKNFRNHF